MTVEELIQYLVKYDKDTTVVVSVEDVVYEEEFYLDSVYPSYGGACLKVMKEEDAERAV